MSKKKTKTKVSASPGKKSDPGKVGRAASQTSTKTTSRKKYKPEYSISKINIEHSSKKKINKERNRIYQQRYRLKNKLQNDDLSKAEMKELHNRIIQSTRFLEACKEKFGTGKPKEKQIGFQKDIEVLDEGRTLQETIFVWEAVGIIDGVIDNVPEIKTYFIDGQEFKRKESMSIIDAVEDMVTEAEFRGEYYFIMNTDMKRKTLSLNFDHSKSK